MCQELSPQPRKPTQRALTWSCHCWQPAPAQSHFIQTLLEEKLNYTLKEKIPCGKMSPSGVLSELWICWQDSSCTAGAKVCWGLCASRWAPCLSGHWTQGWLCQFSRRSGSSVSSSATNLGNIVQKKWENYKEMQGVHSPWSKDMIMQHSRSWILHSTLALASETIRKPFSKNCLSS